MSTSFVNFILFVTTVLTGFYAGTGFFVIMGGNPAILKMSSHTFAEYWQHTDFYMAARMRIFGPMLSSVLLLAVLIHIPAWKTPAFWFLGIAFLILIADMILVLKTNQPLNQLVQSWDMKNLPDNVQKIKFKVVNAFWFRSAFMIGSFVCVTLAVFLRRK